MKKIVDKNSQQKNNKQFFSSNVNTFELLLKGVE